MEKTTGDNILEEMETDLQLLLECLRCQSNDPVQAKQTLLAIGSLCSSNFSSREVLRENGGLKFILNLLLTTRVTDIKESTLFTLGCAVENTPYSQMVLSTGPVFTFINSLLRDSHASPRQLQVTCFLLLGLVSNNSQGQMLARTSECLDALFHIFKTSLPTNEAALVTSQDEESWFEELETQSVEVWTAATNAISGCLNNPQNDDNQRLCAAIFPRAFAYLQGQCSPAVLKPITSLIGLAAANNYHNQQRVQKAGGVKVLMSALHRSVNRIQQAEHQDMATYIISTLDTLISDNGELGKECVQLGMVILLHRLLTSQTFHSHNLLRFIITLGHLLENSVESRHQFTEAGGMASLVGLLTRSNDPQLVNAAKYVLHHCVNEGTNQNTLNVEKADASKNEVPPLHDTQVANSAPLASTSNSEAQRVEKMIDDKLKALERRLSKDYVESELSVSRLCQTKPSTVTLHSDPRSFTLDGNNTIQSIQQNLPGSCQPHGSIPLPMSHYQAPSHNINAVQASGDFVVPNLMSTSIPLTSQTQILTNMTGNVSQPSQNQENKYITYKGASNRGMTMPLPVSATDEHPVPKVSGYSRRQQPRNELEIQLEKERKLRKSMEAKARNLEQTLKDKERKENAQAVALELKKQERANLKRTTLRKDLRHAPERKTRSEILSFLSEEDIKSPLMSSTPNTSPSSEDTNPQDGRQERRGKLIDNPRSDKDIRKDAKIPKCGREEKRLEGKDKSKQAGKARKESVQTQKKSAENLEESEERLESSDSEKSPNKTVGLQTQMSPVVTVAGPGPSVSETPKNRSQSIGVQTPISFNAPLLPPQTQETRKENCFLAPDYHGSQSTPTKPNPTYTQVEVIYFPSALDSPNATLMPRVVSLVPKISSRPETPQKNDSSMMNDSMIIRTPRCSVKKIKSRLEPKTRYCCTPIKKPRSLCSPAIRQSSGKCGVPATPGREFDIQLLQAAKVSNKQVPNIQKQVASSIESLEGRFLRTEGNRGRGNEEFETPKSSRGEFRPPKLVHSSTSSLRRIVHKHVDRNEQNVRDDVDELEMQNQGDQITDTGERGMMENGAEVNAGGDYRVLDQQENRPRKNSKCPGCNPPEDLNESLEHSREYHIMIETNPYTCAMHRQIREEQRSRAHVMVERNERQCRPLMALQNQSRETETDRENRDPYDISLLSDSDDDRRVLPLSPDYQPRLRVRPSPSDGGKRGTPPDRRARVPYTGQELFNLNDGVRKLGKFWNQILVTYEFHPSRTAVDLMEKYKRLQRSQQAASRSPHPPPPRRPFSMAEERRLIRGVKLFGHRWKVIARAFEFAPNREPQDLKDHWRIMQQQAQS